jgi:hypothetical protein
VDDSGKIIMLDISGFRPRPAASIDYSCIVKFTKRAKTKGGDMNEEVTQRQGMEIKLNATPNVY